MRAAILCCALSCATTPPPEEPPPSTIPNPCLDRPRQLLGPKLLEPQYQEAIALSQTSSIAGHLAALVAELPDDPSRHRSFAMVLTELGDLEGSVFHYRCALSLDPALPGARLELAALLVDTSSYAAARTELMRVREETTPDLQARALMASALEGLGALRDAADELAIAAEETKTSAVLYRRAAALYSRAGFPVLADELNSKADDIDPPPAPRELRPLVKAKPEPKKKKSKKKKKKKKRR